MRHRPARPIIALVLILGLAACGGGDDEDSTTTTKRKPTTTTAPPPAAPLTGLPQEDEGKLARPALMVKVDNTPKGLAVQEGLDLADVVFVEQTEHGTTRLAAVYQSRDATVGPVRSARSSDVGLAGALNRPMLAHSGANRGVLREIAAGPLVDVGIDARGVTGIYLRNQRGGTRNLYRFFLPTADFYAARGSEGGPPPALFAYRAKRVPSVGDPARGVRVVYGGGAATDVTYEWDGDGWARSQNGRIHQMAGGGPRIAPPNVVVLMTPYRASGYRDVTGAASPEAVLDGAGEAWFLSDGKLVRGRWARGGPTGTFALTGPDGLPVALTPGQTWIELAPGVASAALL